MRPKHVANDIKIQLCQTEYIFTFKEHFILNVNPENVTCTNFPQVAQVHVYSRNRKDLISQDQFVVIAGNLLISPSYLLCLSEVAVEATYGLHFVS